ncbi:MAG TPA: DUF3987 domain-containing protein [Candidatus Cloacimonas sp.]|nr:DUF3987 domain-containing protein [Candidatus Cloacimonas sp.]
MLSTQTEIQEPINVPTLTTPPDTGKIEQIDNLNVEMLPDFLKQYLDNATKRCNAYPLALLASFLPVISVSLGNKVYITNNNNKIYPNLWVLLIGPSGQSMKSTAMNMALSYLEPYISKLSETDYERLCPTIGKVTPVKLGSMLKENPARLLVFNEFGEFIETANSKNNKGMIQTLTDVYDSNKYSYYSMKHSIDAKNCTLSLSGCSTPGYIQKSFKTAFDQKSGFLQRFIYVVIPPSDESDIITNNNISSDKDEPYDYNKIFELFRKIPGSFEIKFSDEAREFINDYVKSKQQEITNEYGTDAWSFVIRIYAQILLKLCIIYIMMENIDKLANAIEKNECKEFFFSLQISQDMVCKALALCDYFVNNTIKFINIIESGNLENELKTVEKLLLFKDYTASHSELLRRTHLKGNVFSKAISTLNQQKNITIKEVKLKGGKSKKIYHLNPCALDYYDLYNKSY